MVPPTSGTCLRHPLSHQIADLNGTERTTGKDARSPKTKGNAMFRIIGAAVVYGFALYGLGAWLADQQSGDSAN